MGRDIGVYDNYQRFIERFRSAVEQAGRTPDDVKIVAVSKTRTIEEIRAVVECGVRLIGENRVQEARDKFTESDRDFELHMVGHLQRNKAKLALELFDVVQSVDSLRIAKELNKEAGKSERRLRVLVEVNSSGEEQKYGFPPERVIDAVAGISEFPNLAVTGLMTVGPLTDDETEIRRAFTDTHRLFNDVQRQVGGIAGFDELSMGMTDDFEIAIAEGSTMVRIGRAIFGPRSY